MCKHLQVRNARGREMLDAIAGELETAPVTASGDRRQFVLQTVLADDEAKLGRGPKPMPIWLGNILAWVLEKVLSCHLAARWCGCVAGRCASLDTVDARQHV